MSTAADDLAGVMAKSAARGRNEESLTSHLTATLAAARELRDRVGRIRVTDTILGDRFWPVVFLAALTHDTGKIPRGFQAMLAGRTKTWGQRHELVSLGFLAELIDDETALDWVAIAVLTHHQPLTSGTGGRNLQASYDGLDPARLRERLGPIDPAQVRALRRWLRATAHRARLPITQVSAPEEPEDVVEAAARLFTHLLDQWEGAVDADTGLTAVLIQGAVTLSDHLSSAAGSLDLTQPLDGDFRARVDRRLGQKGHALREHQERAAEVSGHLLLRAPTGSGKTEAALLWAATQVIELINLVGGVPRVFYTLPYLSSINAMATRLGAELGSAVGVSHSKAASYHLAAAMASEDGEDPCRVDAATKALSRAAATRLFHESVRVGTPYQLLRAALAGPAHSGILVDSTNSVFILDELHAYDARRLGYTLAAARLWERLGGRVAILSATLPNALTALLGDTLREPITTVDTPTLDQPPRHRLRTRDHHLTDPAAIAEIRLRLDRDESVLVVANNVAHALALFDALAPAVLDRHGPDAAHLLHARFTRGDRSRIETTVLDRFEADPHKPRRPGLLIATQVVEVSLNLDFDVLFTSAATLEALLQRFGRVNRLAARPPADVIVHHPAWTTRTGERGEFADGIYPREPVEAAWRILTAHDGAIIDEADANPWLDQVYATPWGRRWHDEVDRYVTEFDESFLQFTDPFDDRSDLTEHFDKLFEGTEAILAHDRDAYISALTHADGPAGRLLAEEYLIPMPHWAHRHCRFDRDLKVRVVDGDYDPVRGLLAVRGPAAAAYQPGMVL
ncbi:CRISPR-associated helicase Cas3' [Actinokineospora cianjurensis]|uniref:CRISPR-associated Cas3 family helicase n=1 Tax=Actinokineospora cianjurensis TaxID=585224 RepID=A0A421B1Z2_9PSEU|nr:CRISPR-associated helicase Cas3' [Actinokineospora cianjurensis]RLK58377.1 CRISPR-associated Cas3 family helicase [Actinokineospora cianjurensis]